MKKNLLLFLIVLFAFANTGCAQKVGRYHKNLRYEADIYFEQGDYYYAAELYEELLLLDKDNPELNGRLGIAYYHLPPLRAKSIAALEQAVELGDTESLFYLALFKHESYRFYDALDLLAIYERRPERQQDAISITQAKAAASRANDFVKTPVAVHIDNMGAGVNTAMHDYAPVWDIKNQRMYFTSRRQYDDRSQKDFSEQFDENIYIVNLAMEPHFAVRAGSDLNSRSNEAAVACSGDGTQLIAYRTSKDGFSGNLFITEATADGWGKLEKLSDKINSKHQEASASFGGPEENVLYFSSDRPGGYGGKDIYRVQRMPDGSWSDPLNLGPNINTPFDEDAPFVSSDGTLYFASRGHDNMGGYDIFSAIPSGNGYSKPTNMGYPINTPADDIFFSIDPATNTGYMSSDRKGGFGLQDIYSVEFDATGTIIYRGQLVDQNSNVSSRATIKLIDEKKGVERMLFQTEGENNEFVLALEPGLLYTVLVEAEGYETYSKTIMIDPDDTHKAVLNENINLSK